MKILFLEPQPCIRALKYAQGLKSRGNSFEIYFGYSFKTLTEFYGYGDEFFEEFIKLDEKNIRKSIQNIVKKFGIDLIHSHNAPDYSVVSQLRIVN
jgi:hypothetical protein